MLVAELGLLSCPVVLVELVADWLLGFAVCPISPLGGVVPVAVLLVADWDSVVLGLLWAVIGEVACVPPWLGYAPLAVLLEALGFVPAALWLGWLPG